MTEESRPKGVAAKAKARAKASIAWLREHSRAFDHLIRAFQRYSGQQGNQLAGAVTFFGFLSFFPLLALAFSITGYVAVVYPDAQPQIIQAVKSTLPGIGDQLDVKALADARAGAGIFGLIGLLITGIGWIDALRAALRSIWLFDPQGGGNMIVKKVMDVVILVVLGGALIGSVAVSSLATSATRLVLGLAGLGTSVAAGWVLKVLATVVIILFDMVIFFVLYSRLSGAGGRLRQIARGTLLAAIGFEIVKQLGTYYIPTVTSKPIYGTFGLMVGLLVWMNLIARLTLFAGAWTATLGREGPPADARGGEESANEEPRPQRAPSP